MESLCKVCETVLLRHEFSIAFSMTENVVKYGRSCLIYYDNQSRALSKPRLFVIACCTEQL